MQCDLYLDPNVSVIVRRCPGMTGVRCPFSGYREPYVSSTTQVQNKRENSHSSRVSLTESGSLCVCVWWVCVCVCEWMWLCVYMRLSVSVGVSLGWFLCVYMSLFRSFWSMSVCVCGCVFVSEWVCGYEWIFYVCVYLCVSECVCVGVRCIDFPRWQYSYQFIHMFGIHSSFIRK